jgi:hypothetical protein
MQMRDEPKLDEALPIRPTLSRMRGKLRDRNFHFGPSTEQFSINFIQDAEFLNQRKKISISDSNSSLICPAQQNSP